MRESQGSIFSIAIKTIMAGALIGLLTAFVVISDQPAAFEVQIANFTEKNFAAGPVHEAAYLLQQFGGAVAVGLAALLASCFLALQKQREWKKILALLSFPLVVFLMVFILKLAVGRERPTDTLTSPGFPSFHAAVSFFYLLLYRLYSFKKIPIAIISIPFLVAGSRVIAGDHYVLDVVGGLLLGYIIYKIYYLVFLPKQNHG